MAKIRNLILQRSKGTLADMVLTHRNGIGTIARAKATEVFNPQTTPQMVRRVKWANLVNFYKISKAWMPKAFESKKRNQSDYNKFMSLNINSAQVNMPKQWAEQGGTIAAPYVISQGSLPSIQITQMAERAFATSLALGDLIITADTTVAEFTEALLANNKWVELGWQLSFISYQQDVNKVTGVPFCICGYYEVTLDLSDSTKLSARMPNNFAAATVQNGGNYLGTGAELSAGAFAYIFSDRKNSKIRVSSQPLTVVDNDFFNNAITAQALADAIASYGSSSYVFLTPGYEGGSVAQGGTNSMQSVNWPQSNQTAMFAGSRVNYSMTFNGLSQSSLRLNFINPVTESAEGSYTLSATNNGGTTKNIPINSISVDGNSLILNFGLVSHNGSDADAPVVAFRLTAPSGQSYSISFTTQAPPPSGGGGVTVE